MYRELDRSTGNVIRINYNLDGHPVCLGTWSAFYGVAKSTAEIIDRNVRRGDTIWNDGLLKEAKLQKQAAKAPLLAAATEWWYIQLGYYEIVVEKGVIIHPRDINFSAMYEDVFVPEMRALGVPWKLPPFRTKLKGSAAAAACAAYVKEKTRVTRTKAAAAPGMRGAGLHSRRVPPISMEPGTQPSNLCPGRSIRDSAYKECGGRWVIRV